MPLRLLLDGLGFKLHRRPDLVWPSELKKSYDVVIIGGGGHGLATAYYLAKDWGIQNVCVLERSYIGSGNTGRNTTVIRSNYSTPESVRFHKEAVQLFKGLSSELGINLMYSQRGQLNLAHSEATVRTFRQRAEVNQLYGVRTELIDLRQIKEIVPFLNTERLRQPILAGLWHRDGGTARHDAVAWGYAMGAMRLGAEVHQDTPAVGLLVEKGRVRAVETARGRILADHVVQAVAGMSSEVARWVGIRLPVRTMPLQAMVSEPLEPFLDPILSSVELHTYVSQTARGELVIGGNTDHYDLYSTRTSLETKETLAANTLEMLPFLSKIRILRQWSGMTDVTPDASPIIGESPVRNYWLNSGCGTWGFKTTPVTGKYLAQAIATAATPPILRPYRLDRFKTFDLVAEVGSSAISH